MMNVFCVKLENYETLVVTVNTKIRSSWVVTMITNVAFLALSLKFIITA